MPTTRTTHTTVVARSSLRADVDALLRASAGRACKQERTAQRLVELSHGIAFNLGRQTLTQTLVTLGDGAADWSAAYNLFHQPRMAIERLGASLLAQVLAVMGRRRPLVSVLDSTRLPRAGNAKTGAPRLHALPRHPQTMDDRSLALAGEPPHHGLGATTDAAGGTADHLLERGHGDRISGGTIGHELGAFHGGARSIRHTLDRRPYPPPHPLSKNFWQVD